MHESGQGGEHLLGGGRVERRGRLVEHQHPRMHGQHRSDRDPLLLAAGQGAQVTVPQVGDAEQVEGLLDPPAHGVGSEAELLHAVGELLLDGVGDEAGSRVLADVADQVGALARRLVDDRATVDQDVAGQGAAGEARHQPGHDAEQGGLADAGAPGDDDQLALVEGQVDVSEDRTVAVPEPDTAQLDHAGTSPGYGGSRSAQGATEGDAGGGECEQAERRRDGQRRVGDGQLVVRHPPDRQGHHPSGGRDHCLRPQPRSGPVAGAPDPATCAPDREERHDHADRQHRAAHPGGRGLVERAVDADADRAETEEHQPSGGTTFACGGAGRAAVAAGVHARGQREGALQRVLEHRDEQPPEPAHLAALAAAQRLGGPDPPEAVGQVRQHGDRHDECAADLVERRGHRAEQPLGVGQGVGGADADHDGGEAEPVVQPEEQRLLGDRPEQAEPERPVRQRDRRQGEQHAATVAASDEDPEDHTDHHDRQTQPEVEPERVGPRQRAAPCGHRQAGHPDQHQEEPGVGGERRGDRQTDRPEPPGDGVQVPRKAGDREPGAHQEPPARFRRTTATAPAATKRAATRTGATQPGRPESESAAARSRGSAAFVVAGRSVGSDCGDGDAVFPAWWCGGWADADEWDGVGEPDAVAVGEEVVGEEVGPAVGDDDA